MPTAKVDERTPPTERYHKNGTVAISQATKRLRSNRVHEKPVRMKKEINYPGITVATSKAHVKCMTGKR